VAGDGLDEQEDGLDLDFVGEDGPVAIGVRHPSAERPETLSGLAEWASSSDTGILVVLRIARS